MLAAGEKMVQVIFSLHFPPQTRLLFSGMNFTRVVELPNDLIDPLFEATVQAVEEAIINAMVAAETMEGINGNKAYALAAQSGN